MDRRTFEKLVRAAIGELPEEFRKNEYELFVQQLYNGEEVGRITWRLVPSHRKERP